MRAKVFRYVKIAGALLGVSLLTFLAVRIYDSQRGLPLEPWHTHVPLELSREKLDASNWTEYLAAEAKVFDEVQREVSRKLDAADRVPANRYFEGSPVYPGHFAQDFNRSFVLEPKGKPVGAVVLLHGLTDSPYSQRHIAAFYRDRGFVAVVPRMPAHGTVPAALTDVEWEDWLAATRLAVREARSRTEPSMPLHLVGFSNGGALALIYALDSLERRKVGSAGPPGVDFADGRYHTRSHAMPAWQACRRFCPPSRRPRGSASCPSSIRSSTIHFPLTALANPIALTRDLQERIARYGREGKLGQLPPILTFQSLIDFTVSTRAIVSALYAQLPENGHELVLFDVNRTAKFGPLLRSSADTALARIVPSASRNYRLTVITNSNDNSDDVIERVTEAGSDVEKSRPLGLSYPRGFYSLSHVALPFPVSDALYGAEPDPSENFGENLGTLAPRGERNVLIASLDSLMRASSNPFFPYMTDRIGEGIPALASGDRPLQ